MTPLDRRWLIEAIHLQETLTGPLEDSEAVRRARQQGGSLGQRLEARALWLAERNGMAGALAHWRQSARLGFLALLVLALASGAGMALAALGDGSRPVNVFWALGSVLGLNLLSLLAWCASGLASRQAPALGRAWLWLGQRLARDAQAVHMGPAFWSLLQRHQLGRWLFGRTVHSLWLASALSAGLTLLLLLATRRYGFVWETTLLSSEAFVRLTAALGSLPAALGFAVPGGEAVRASGEAAVASARQPWASWLLGVLVAYGVLPRALLAAWCWQRWQQGRQRLLAEPPGPTCEALRERLMPSSEAIGVLDAEQPTAATTAAARPNTFHPGTVVVGLELANPAPWPQPLPAHDAGVLDDRQSRERLLDALAAQPPERLLVACDPQRSLDRGTLALLTELARSARQMRIWLLPSANQDPLRLADWHTALATAGLAHCSGFPTDWLEGNDA